MAERPQGSSDRAFGFVMAAFFAIVGLFPLFAHHEPRAWALFIALWFALFAGAVPHVLAPLNRVWTAIGNLLHAIVSPLALGILFFGVVAPTGVLMRLLGKDPLRLAFDRGARSYWIDRDPPGPAPESLKDQF